MMGLAEEWKTSEYETISNAFSNCDDPAQQVKVTIVGGGLSGLLLALKLSRESSRMEGKIALIDAAANLGGRLLFSDARVERLAVENEAEFFKQRRESAKQKGVSGPGFESLDPSGLEILERHLRSSLTDDELEFLDTFCCDSSLSEPHKSNTLIVRRELTPWKEALEGPSDAFTRKESDFLAHLVELAEGETTGSSDEAEKQRFCDAPVWKSASEQLKDGVLPTLEAILGRSCLEGQRRDFMSGLRSFSRLATQEPPPLFRRDSGIEFALELILRNRGVQVLTGTRVTRLLPRKEGGFDLQMSGRGGRKSTQLQSDKVALCVPLISSFSFLPRDLFTGSQSKSVLRYPPSSLVAVEYPMARSYCKPESTSALESGARHLFPTERCLGLVNSAGNLLCYAYLPYEDSLEAAAVRETVGRLRRAAARLLTETALKGLSGQEPLAAKSAAAERVVLVSAARYLHTPGTSVKETRMGMKGLFHCGDGFTFADSSWKNIVESVHDVANSLVKG